MDSCLNSFIQLIVNKKSHELSYFSLSPCREGRKEVHTDLLVNAGSCWYDAANVFSD